MKQIAIIVVIFALIGALGATYVVISNMNNQIAGLSKSIQENNLEEELQDFTKALREWGIEYD